VSANYQFCYIHGGFYGEGTCPRCAGAPTPLNLSAGICARHGFHAGGPCAECAAEQPPHLLALIHELRDTIGALESRIADQGEEIAALRRRVDRQEQGEQHRQHAHNALASTQDHLEQRINLQGETLSSLGRRQDMLDEQAQRRDVRIGALAQNLKSFEERIDQEDDS
jgi:septal ring factor EnvC (AmiA/AmiB activator)